VRTINLIDTCHTEDSVLEKKKSMLCNLTQSLLFLNVYVISRRSRWARHAARMKEGRGAYSILVGRPEGRSPLGKPREDNIKMDRQEVGWGMDWIELAQDREQWRVIVNTVMNHRVP
jgi:hypothetical protein